MFHRTYLLPHEGEGTVRRTSPHGWSLRLPCVLPACTQRDIPSLKSHSGQVTQTYLADRTAEQPRALDLSSKIRDRRIDLRWTDEPNSTAPAGFLLWSLTTVKIKRFFHVSCLLSPNYGFQILLFLILSRQQTTK